MRGISKGIASIPAIITVLLSSAQAYGWHDQTHLSIAQAAGFERWYSSAAPDVAKSREQFRPVEEKNHYFNNNGDRKVTAAMVMEQVERYLKPDDVEGHLYGAIVGSVRDYRALKATGKYADYPLVFTAHYVGDLSMPLHNTAYDDFNRERHSKNDGVIERSALNNIGYIQRNMYEITIRNDEDLASEIARVAESSRRLGALIRKEKRDMTPDEAYTRIIHSASLFRAILVYVGKNPA